MNRQTATIRGAFPNIHRILRSRGSEPKVYIMYNEFSSDLKEAMKKYTIDFQLAPLYMHRRNATERAIITWKNNFISRLSITDPDFPLREWDQLISQLLITLNPLRNSRVNPALSAYAYIFGPYDFNKYSMAPPGTILIFQYIPVIITSWVHHFKMFWYIGPFLDNYRFV